MKVENVKCIPKKFFLTFTGADLEAQPGRGDLLSRGADPAGGEAEDGSARTSAGKGARDHTRLRQRKELVERSLSSDHGLTGNGWAQ